MGACKRILFYNWCPFDLKKNQGGGVSVYIKNVLNYFASSDTYELYFLNSGHAYNPMTSETYIQKTENMYGEKVKSYEIINSRVLGPLFASSRNLNTYMEDDSTVEVLSKFIEEQGGFDVIHINNLGGLSQKVLTLKQKFPETKFIYDLHNYNSLCVNSLLFDKIDEVKCEDYGDGNNCLKCIQLCKPISRIYKRRVKDYFKKYPFDLIKYIFLKLFGRLDDSLTNHFKSVGKHNPSAEDFVNMRKNHIKYINENMDVVLAVSQRVKDILISNGLDEQKVKLSYIGTKFADNPNPPREYNSKDLTIAYIGYANAQKGYNFMLNALANLPKEVASKINVVLAAAKMNKEIVKEKLQKFASLTMYDGYKPNELKDILKEVDLGIVPVIWEDNLPQVAIEMASFGIPVLASDFGGASELSSSEFFKFKGADAEDFLSKLMAIVEQPELLEDYWKCFNKLTTMQKHCDFLKTIYEG